MTAYIASIWSWFGAARLQTIALVVTAIAGSVIGWKAWDVARTQRNLAAIDLFDRAMDKLEQPEFVMHRRQVALDYLIGCNPDEVAAGFLLNFLDDLYIYRRMGRLPIKVIDDRLGYNILCWWYALQPIFKLERSGPGRDRTWDEAQKLVQELQRFNASLGDNSWAQRPSDLAMEHHFRGVIKWTRPTLN